MIDFRVRQAADGEERTGGGGGEAIHAAVVTCSGGAARRQRDVVRGLNRGQPFVTTPQAMRSPAAPAGSVFMSSGPAWMTSAVPPLAKTEFASLPSVMPCAMTMLLAVPSAAT